MAYAWQAIPDHNACRKLICAVCLSESQLKATRTVSESVVKLIKEYVSTSYDPEDPRFATGICDKCRQKLLAKVPKPNHKESQVSLWVSKQFCVDLPPQTRGNTQTSSCKCTICVLARMYGGAWNKFKYECKKMESILLKKDENYVPIAFPRSILVAPL